jgi:hypothetical protein
VQKVFGILFIVLAIWVGIEVFTKGMDGAFGGLLAGHSHAQASVESGGLPSRARDRVNSAMRTREERTLLQTEPEGGRSGE